MLVKFKYFNETNIFAKINISYFKISLGIEKHFLFSCNRDFNQ